MDEIQTTGFPFEETINLGSLLGVRVLADNGLQVGKVISVHLHPKSRKLEGILVRPGIFKHAIYIDSSYIEKWSGEAVILTMEPSVLYKRRKVITMDGEIIGKVKDIVRKELTNTIEYITVKPLFRKAYTIKQDQIRSFGSSIILKASYHAPKKHFFARS